MSGRYVALPTLAAGKGEVAPRVGNLPFALTVGQRLGALGDDDPSSRPPAASAAAASHTERDSPIARPTSPAAGDRPSPRSGRCSTRLPYTLRPPSRMPSAPASAASQRPAFGLGWAAPSRR